jgi:hypothetical protein
VPAEYGPLRTVGGLLVALAGLGGLGALIFAQRRDDLTLSHRCKEEAYECIRGRNPTSHDTNSERQ